MLFDIFYLKKTALVPSIFLKATAPGYDTGEGSQCEVTADTALRLARYLRTDPKFWLNLQAANDPAITEPKTDYSKLPECA